MMMREIPTKTNTGTDPNSRYFTAVEANSVFSELENVITNSDGGNLTLNDASITQLKESIIIMVTRALNDFKENTGYGISTCPSYGSNLNLFKVAGIYSFTSSASPLPQADLGGIIVVFRSGTNNMIQVASVYGGTSSTQAGMYVRYLSGGTGISESAPSNITSWRKLFMSEDTSALILSMLNTYGIATDRLASSVSNLNDINVSGFYRASSSTLNTPVSGNFYTVLVMAGGDDGGVTVQLAVDTNNAGSLWTRQKTLIFGWGVWVPYQPLIRTYTPVYTSDITIPVNETRYIRYSTANNAFTITLPVAPNGTEFVFVNSETGRYDGQSINRLTVVTPNGFTIDGDVSAFLDKYLSKFSLLLSDVNWQVMEF